MLTGKKIFFPSLKMSSAAPGTDANSTFMKAFGILGIFPKKNPYRKE